MLRCSEEQSPRAVPHNPCLMPYRESGRSPPARLGRAAEPALNRLLPNRRVPLPHVPPPMLIANWRRRSTTTGRGWLGRGCGSLLHPAISQAGGDGVAGYTQGRRNGHFYYWGLRGALAE